MTFITDCLAVACISLGLAAAVAGCIEQPTFVDQCSRCGEYLPDTIYAHVHLSECPPCDGSQEGGPWKK